MYCFYTFLSDVAVPNMFQKCSKFVPGQIFGRHFWTSANVPKMFTKIPRVPPGYFSETPGCGQQFFGWPPAGNPKAATDKTSLPPTRDASQARMKHEQLPRICRKPGCGRMGLGGSDLKSPPPCFQGIRRKKLGKLIHDTPHATLCHHFQDQGAEKNNRCSPLLSHNDARCDHSTG